VVGACSEVPTRIEAAEVRLVGQPASASLAPTIQAVDLDGLAPIDDVRGTAGYRRDVALTLVRRAVGELLA
jgi:CO/xanthine dehydrogenase FAD-binding subunit